MVYVVSLSVCVWSKSSPIMFTCVSLISHLAIFPRNLASSIFPELRTLILQPLSFLPYLLKPHSTQRHQNPFPTKTPQPAKTPTSLTYWNPTAHRDSNQHYSPKMHRVVRQLEHLSKNAQRSPDALHSKLGRGVLPRPSFHNSVLCLKTAQGCPSCPIYLACRNCTDEPPRASSR